ncbi:hypothetical protein ES731_01380 [Psychroflexus gondwanensis]|jgi:hypothetical protein|uniref:hypothetical protein n=1 Tax=Psychroflexus gondwanensis TaxID=251 RepID=UPI0011BE2ECB|nr:hypothetical protein [Psychroflexus gondwanensis]TXE21580.1 hypothetical protein ES731_01380 [Psychroflexus gondwanensis]
MKKLAIIFYFFSLTLFSQEIKLNVSNFENYIKEVYKDKADQLIFSNPKQLKNKKEILDRIVIINNVENMEEDYLDFETLYIVTTYNKDLSLSFPKRIYPDRFNPFLYKMNIYNDQPVYYYYHKTKQLIKIYPSKY